MAAIPTPNTGGPAGLAFDARSLESLKARASSDPKGAARAAAKQFEALFMQELLKSMRSATLASGMLDNEGSKLGTEMLDTQLATQMSGLPGGLSDIIARQMERQMGLAPGPIPTTRRANDTPAPLESAARPTRIPQAGAAGFVQQHRQDHCTRSPKLPPCPFAHAAGRTSTRAAVPRPVRGR